MNRKHDLVVVEKKGKSGAILQQGGQATEGSKCYSFKKHVPAELIKALPTVDFNKAFVCGDCDDKVDVNATVFEIMTYKIITKERMYEHFISYVPSLYRLCARASTKMSLITSSDPLYCVQKAC